MKALAIALVGTILLNAASLTPVYTNNDFQITGVSMSPSARMFVNFPRWSDRYLNAVIEVDKSGTGKPFPNEEWNRWDGKPDTAKTHFVCVQSVVADDTDTLWIVDPAAPNFGLTIQPAAKLVTVNLKTNQVTRVYTFTPEIVKPATYLNDIRIDTKRHTAYLTDSGVGGLIVVDTQSGKAHRALDGDKSVMKEAGISISVNGKPVLQNGKPPQFNSDAIALSPDGDYLYYQALTGATMYRVKTEALRNGNTPIPELFAKTFPLDGIWMDKQGRLYLSNINESAIYRMSLDKKLEKVAQSPDLEWPDTFTQGPDGSIYITSSHINDMPRFHEGKSTRTKPYAIFKM